jgi:hypothetical protein
VGMAARVTRACAAAAYWEQGTSTRMPTCGR